MTPATLSFATYGKLILAVAALDLKSAYTAVATHDRSRMASLLIQLIDIIAIVYPPIKSAEYAVEFLDLASRLTKGATVEELEIYHPLPQGN